MHVSERRARALHRDALAQRPAASLPHGRAECAAADPSQDRGSVAPGRVSAAVTSVLGCDRVSGRAHHAHRIGAARAQGALRSGGARRLNAWAWILHPPLRRVMIAHQNTIRLVHALRGRALLLRFVFGHLSGINKNFF